MMTPAVQRDNDDPRQQRRREILQSAKAVFAEHGFHNASISDIIHRAEIARGTFYLYFQSKQAIFDSILDEALAELRSRITRIVLGADAPSPHAQLRENLVRVLDYVLGDQPLTLILLNHKQSPDTDVAQRIALFFAGVARLIQSSLDYGITLGLVRPCNTALIADALVGTVRGVVEHCLEEPEQPDTGTIVDELIAFVQRGVFVG